MNEKEVRNHHPGLFLGISFNSDLLIPTDLDYHCFVIDGYRRTRIKYTHYHYFVLDENPSLPCQYPEEYYTYTYSSPELTSIKINWGWWTQWENGVNDGWFSLTAGWTVTNQGETYDYNHNVKMTYGFTLANQWFYYIFARYNLQITHMKKSIVLLIVSLLSLSLEAQERLSYTLEIVAAAGIGRGPLASLTPQFAVQYDLGAGFIIGAGAGARFAAPCLQYINKNGTMTRQFCEELDIPVFLRLGYGMEQYFATLDAGYALGVFSFYGASGGSGKGPGACYSGLFFEPQVGRSVGRRGALSLGVLMQRSIVEDVVIKESGTTGTPSSSVSSTHNTRKLMTPAITLRYGFLF